MRVAIAHERRDAGKCGGLRAGRCQAGSPARARTRDRRWLFDSTGARVAKASGNEDPDRQAGGVQGSRSHPIQVAACGRPDDEDPRPGDLEEDRGVRDIPAGTAR